MVGRGRLCGLASVAQQGAGDIPGVSAQEAHLLRSTRIGSAVNMTISHRAYTSTTEGFGCGCEGQCNLLM